MVGVAVAETAGGPRVAVTGAGSNGVFRVPALETALGSGFSADALKTVKIPTTGPQWRHPMPHPNIARISSASWLAAQ